MDNELHALEKTKKKVGVIGHHDSLMLAELLSVYGLVSHLYQPPGHPWSVGRNWTKHPPEPPSKKPVDLRDEYDYARLQKAEERRKRKRAKNLKLTTINRN